MAPRKWIIPSCTGIGGLVVGLLLGGALPGNDPGESPGISQVPGRSSTDGLDGRARGESQLTLSLEDVRRVVREELAASNTGSAPAGNPSAADPPEPPGEAAIAANEDARRVLVAAIARRQWTQADADALRSRFHAMSGADQDELLRQFSMAVNQGRLVVETDQVPF